VTESPRAFLLNRASIISISSTVVVVVVVVLRVLGDVVVVDNNFKDD